MSFHVNIDAVQKMADGMQRQAEAMQLLSTHFAKVDEAAFTGLLSDIRPRVEAVKDRNTHLATVAHDGSSHTCDNLVKTSQYYAGTDSAAAARFDSTLPARPYVIPMIPGGDLPRTTGAYVDFFQPRGRLNEPPSYDDKMTWKWTLEADLKSPTNTLRSFIAWCMGEDPLETIAQGLLGDWREIRRAADIFNDASWAYFDAQANISDYLRQAQHDWSGNAASTAYEYLHSLVVGMVGESEVNKVLHERFKTLAEEAFAIFVYLSGEVGAWIDKIIQAGISAIAAGGTAEIPVLNIFTSANAAWRLYDAVDSGYDILSATMRLKDMLNAFAAVLNMDDPNSFDAKNNGHKIPAGSYQSPA